MSYFLIFLRSTNGGISNKWIMLRLIEHVMILIYVHKFFMSCFKSWSLKTLSLTSKWLHEEQKTAVRPVQR